MINHTANANTFSYTVYFLCITVLSSNVLDGTVKQILTHLSPPATIVAALYSCHFPCVSIFLDVIHVECRNVMQGNNQIKDFKKKKRYSLPSCHMRLSTSYPYFQEAWRRQTLPKKANFHITNKYFLLTYIYQYNHEGL